MQNPKFRANLYNPLEALHQAITAIINVVGAADTEIRLANDNYIGNAKIMGSQEQANELHRNYVLIVMFTEQLVRIANNLGRLAGSVDEPLELIRRAPLKSKKSST